MYFYKNEKYDPQVQPGPRHAKRARTTWHVISSNLHLKSSAKNGGSNWVLIQGAIFTVCFNCYFRTFITSIMLFGEWSGQKLKLKMDKICRPGPFRITQATWTHNTELEILIYMLLLKQNKGLGAESQEDRGWKPQVNSCSGSGDWWEIVHHLKKSSASHLLH